MRPLLILGFVGVLALAFFGGRVAGTRTAPASSGATAATATAAGEPEAAPAPVATIDPSSARSVMRALSEDELENIALEPGAIDETAKAREARHKEMRASLALELGKISKELESHLVDLNDRAVAFQRGLTGEFEQGQISHEEYMNRFHTEMLVQLGELHVLLNDDQYRTLTGLQPGVDPYDYMKTGMGGALAESDEVEPLTDDQARPDFRPDVEDQRGVR